MRSYYQHNAAKSLIHLCVFADLQLKGEIYQSSKKGHVDGKGLSLLSDLRNKCAKLLSEVEDYETHEELLNHTLRDITTGRTTFDWSSHSCPLEMTNDLCPLSQ